MVASKARTVNWAVDVASRLKGVQFPIDEHQAREKLQGMMVKGKDIDEVLSRVDFPVDTPASLLHQISDASE